MKKLIISILLVLLLFSGCFSVPDVGNFSLSDKIGESVAASLGLDDLAIEMQAVQFYALYFSYAFYGGYNYETGFAEGQGVRWKFSSVPAKGERNDSEYERIFLKDMGDGRSWWRLGVVSENETVEYEYLMNNDSEFLAIRFKDSETGEIVEYNPPVDEEESSESETESETEELSDETEGEFTAEDYETYNSYEYKQYSLGDERITVGAGSYKAEHMVSEVKDNSDPDYPVDLKSDWWITESVPGGVVKYVWLDNISGDKMDSELMAILERQTTKMDSY